MFLRGTTLPPTEIDPESYKPFAVCPPVVVRAGTQSITVANGFQATVVDKARECTTANGQLTLKVGVAGRVLAGRSGGSLNTTLPVRIAVVKDGDVPVYSQLFRVPVSVTSPQTSARWVHVQDAITVPDEGVLEIYVGFDDGGKSSQPPPVSASVPVPGGY